MTRLRADTRPRRGRLAPAWRARLLSRLLVAALLLPAVPAQALVQTGAERMPTWVTFPHRVSQKAREEALYRGMALFCEFPEQIPPRTPNPRWEDERPWRLHFVERMNPAFSRCLIRVFFSRPEFVDHEIEAALRLEFEKAVPPKFGIAPAGERAVELRQRIFLEHGRFRLPEFTGSPDQGVKLSLTIHGKLVGEVDLQVDSRHVLRIHEVRRQDLNDAPIRRGWDLR